MTINQIIGNQRTESRIDTELWKKMNKKYSGIEHKAEEIPIENTLEQKIIYDSTGKPTIKLTPLTQTIINITTQDEYDTLMKIYDAGNWKWSDNTNSIMKNKWLKYTKRTTIDAKNEFFYEDKIIEKIVTKNRIISLKEFYKIQNITQNTIEELNNYYHKNHPNRTSKG
jgi:hypothetical protein